jgi:hypothetical protein
LVGATGKSTGYSAAIDKNTIGSTYVNQDQLLKIAEALQSPEKSLASDADIAKTTKLLPDGSQIVAYLNPSGVVPIARSILKATGQPIQVPDFPKTSPLGGALKISGEAFESDLVIPSDFLEAAGLYGMSFMGAQQQGGGPPPATGTLTPAPGN